MHSTPRDPALWLEEFTLKLSSASSNLYGNGRQQAEISLTANVQPGQPALTPAQLDSLKLVLEKPDGTYEPLPFNQVGPLDWWQTNARDTRFDLMPNLAGIQPVAPTTPTASKLLYVSTSQPGGSNVKLRACIQKDDNTVYYTDRVSGFDASVILTTVRPPSFGDDDYEWGISYSAGEIDHTFVHEYSLKLKKLGLSSASETIVPGMIRWQRNETNERYATYVGMALPGSKTIHYETRIDAGADFVPAKEAQTGGDETLVLVLNGANNIPYHRPSLEYGGPCRANIIDRHGNDHYVQFRFDDQGSPLERRTKIIPSYASLAKHA